MRRDASDRRPAALWTPTTAEREARRFGIDPLVEKHWKVIALSREWYAQTGRAPELSDIAAAAGLTPREIADLFRADPVQLIIRIAGLTDPLDPATRSANP